jgi:hypothetical protein
LSSSEGSGSIVRGTLGAIGVGVVALVALSFMSTPLLHWGQRDAGFRPTPLQARAWFTDPQSIGNGAVKGSPIVFDVSLPAHGSVSWRAQAGGIDVAHGTVTGSPGTAVEVTTSTTYVRADQWLTIWISGIHTPLRVWVLK